MDFEYLKTNTIPFYGHTILGNPIPASPRAPIVGHFSIAELKQIIRRIEGLIIAMEAVAIRSGHMTPLDDPTYIQLDDKYRQKLLVSIPTLYAHRMEYLNLLDSCFT